MSVYCQMFAFNTRSYSVFLATDVSQSHLLYSRNFSKPRSGVVGMVFFSKLFTYAHVLVSQFENSMLKLEFKFILICQVTPNSEGDQIMNGCLLIFFYACYIFLLPFLLFMCCFVVTFFCVSVDSTFDHVKQRNRVIIVEGVLYRM